MLKEFRKYIFENNLIKPDEKVLLAVSGGIDSMVMTHLFQQNENKIAIAHCNFTLRGSESDEDEEMVRNYAVENDIPFHVARFDTAAFAKKNGLSIQMAARELRYKWFEKIRKENSYNKIAIAHNLNDNIETFIINLIRGTGIAGLTGMRPSNNRIIRPILFASRQQVSDYCSQNKIKYREDKTNADTKYIRNKIRHNILPVLKEINPSIEATLIETSEKFTGISEIVTEHIEWIRGKVSEKEGLFILFNISLLKPHIKNKTILYELFKPFGITSQQLNDLRKVIQGKTGGQLFTASHRIVKNRKEIIVSNESNSEIATYTIRNDQEFRKVPIITSFSEASVTGAFEIPSDPFIACIDAEKIIFPLTVRKWRPGDYFYPLGMKQKKKLSDYFIDNKYSRIEKENIQILESDGNIVWVIGDRIDNRYKITRSTNKAFIIKSLRKKPIIKPLR